MELVTQIDTSLKKLTELCATQEAEMTQYEETEQLAVDDKKKRLHYERIRIQEIKGEIELSLKEIQQKNQEIDDKVNEDAKPQLAEKHRINNQVDELDKKILELEKQLEVMRR